DVGRGHDQVVIANGWPGTVLNGAPMDGHALADHVVIADDQPRWLALVFQVRGVLANGRELIDAIVTADPRRAPDDHVRGDHRPLAYLDVWPDDRPWPHLAALGQPGGRIEHGMGVHSTQIIRPRQIIAAEQVPLPSAR